MAVITLPDTMVPSGATPFLRDFGSVQTPFLGGEDFRVNRLGMRLGGRFVMPPKVYGTDGRVLINRLILARQQRLVVSWPQPGFDPGDEGTPKVKVAVSGGNVLQIKGLPADKPLYEGQFLSVCVASEGGRRYLHPLAQDESADASGDAVVHLSIPIRMSFAVNDIVEIADPKIEGHVLPGDELSWSISVEHLVDIQFSVVEAK